MPKMIIIECSDEEADRMVEPVSYTHLQPGPYKNRGVLLYVLKVPVRPDTAAAPTL